MKNQNKWCRTWKKSVQPRKQRAYTKNCPINIRGNIMCSHLSKELKEKHGTRSIRIKKGDKIKVLRGQFKRVMGKVEKVNTKRQRIFVTGVEQEKMDGSKALYPIHPSNVSIIELDLEDKRRLGEKK